MSTVFKQLNLDWNAEPNSPAPRVTVAPPRTTARTTPARKAAVTKGVAAQQARARGFALDLAQGGPDADDANFKEYA